MVPVEPHLFTLETLPKLADVLRLAGNPPALFVVNKAPTQGTEAASAGEYIKAQGLSVCPVILHLRAAHRHATNIGKVAGEYDPEGKAAQEVMQLYLYTMQFIKTSRRLHAKTKRTDWKALTDNQLVRQRNEKPAQAAESSRSGRVLIAGHFDTEVQTAMKIVAAEERTTVQALLAEGINTVFAKRHKPQIAK